MEDLIEVLHLKGRSPEADEERCNEEDDENRSNEGCVYDSKNQTGREHRAECVERAEDEVEFGAVSRKRERRHRIAREEVRQNNQSQAGIRRENVSYEPDHRDPHGDAEMSFEDRPAVRHGSLRVKMDDFRFKALRVGRGVRIAHPGSVGEAGADRKKIS